MLYAWYVGDMWHPHSSATGSRGNTLQILDDAVMELDDAVIYLEPTEC